jgi:DNA-binding response OmpR family regulator
MHVIHVEDEFTLRAILEIGFKAVESDMDLHQFRSGEEALPYIKEKGSSVDLFILDLSLPGTLDGLDLAHKIRELDYQGGIILTSGCDVPAADMLRVLRCEFLPKPWQVGQLTRKLPGYGSSRQGPQPDGTPDARRGPAVSSRR